MARAGKVPPMTEYQASQPAARPAAAWGVSGYSDGHVLGDSRPDVFDSGPCLLRVSRYTRDFDGSDSGQIGDASVQPGAEGDVRGGRVVVDDDGQRRVRRDGPEKFEHIIIG
jgi:hypothetical protein